MFTDERACSSVWLERTPDKREVDGSTPSRPTTLKAGSILPARNMKDGGVAQLGERLPCTQEVIGSNPFTSTIFSGGRLKAENKIRVFSFELFAQRESACDGFLSHMIFDN